jgi:hypothetical protein
MSLVALLISAVACGSDRPGAPPTIENGSGGSASEPTEQPEESMPGVCRKLCCSSADCPNSGVCTQFDAALGTLGVCASDEAPAADGTSFTSACFSTQPAPECNPISGEGCEPGNTCDYYGQQVACFGGENSQGAGAACDEALGPWCVPGYHCVPS